MGKTANLVVSRTDDRVVVMVPGVDDDVRMHAIMSEEEALCASNAIRRMMQSRDPRTMVLGSEVSGLRIDRVVHPHLPIELTMEDDGGATVVDLTKDDASGLADLLWGAHRSTGPFHAMTSIVGAVRRREHSIGSQVVPKHDGPRASDAALLGDLNRRVRGARPEGKT